LQTHLRAEKKILQEGKIYRVCGVDAAYFEDDSVISVASVFDSRTLQLLERKHYRGRVTFPYISSLFYLREGPFACEVVSKLQVKPDLVCFDAQGYAHPRRSGLATICGMILGIPSIGISKSKLLGDTEPYLDGMEKLVIDRELVGFVTQSPKRFWSPGFSVSISGLENVIKRYRDICIRSISESHKFALEMNSRAQDS